jgi:hypothetical protein
MAGKRQEAAVEPAFLAAQDRAYHGLGVIINHRTGTPLKKAKARL